MYAGLLCGVLGLPLLIYEPIVAAILIFLFFLVLSTVYKLDIFIEDGVYHDYLWLLGMKKGKKYEFKKIDNLILSKHTYKQRLNSRGSSTVIEYDLYKGFIVFDDDNKVLIGESKRKIKIEKRISKLKKELTVTVLDTTEE